jgi:hypothetical protein
MGWNVQSRGRLPQGKAGVKGFRGASRAVALGVQVAILCMEFKRMFNAPASRFTPGRDRAETIRPRTAVFTARVAA